MSTHILVSCVSAKSPAEAPARLLYRSPWFLKAKRYAEESGFSWHILSALHGVLDPDQVVAPYQHTLNTATTAERRVWAARAHAALDSSLAPASHLVILAGHCYRKHLVPLLIADGHTISVPMRGMGIGHQMHYLDTTTVKAALQPD